MNIEIARGKSYEECIEMIEKGGKNYEVISERDFVSNWMAFWRKTHEIVYRTVDVEEQTVEEVEEIALMALEKSVIPESKDVDEKKRLMALLDEENEKLSEEMDDKERIAGLEMKLRKIQGENTIPEQFGQFFELLKDKEIEEKMAKEIVSTVAEGYVDKESTLKKEEVMESMKNLIGSKIKIKGPMEAEKTKIIAFVGPTGVGKTTTLAKLGWELHSMGRTVGFITTDTFRSGAKEQLKNIGEILGTEVVVAKGSKELKSAIKYFQNANKVDHILIDTVGRNPMLEETSDAVKEYLEIAKPDLNCLVMSSTAKVADMKKTLAMFGSVKIDGLIFTKLDETFNPGSIINVFNYTDIPLMYVANGQDITKNLFAPTKEVLINKVLTGEEELKGKLVV